MKPVQVWVCIKKPGMRELIWKKSSLSHNQCRLKMLQLNPLRPKMSDHHNQRNGCIRKKSQEPQKHRNQTLCGRLKKNSKLLVLGSTHLRTRSWVNIFLLMIVTIILSLFFKQTTKIKVGFGKQSWWIFTRRLVGYLMEDKIYSKWRQINLKCTTFNSVYQHSNIQTFKRALEEY